MAKITKKRVKEFFDREREHYKTDLSQYSTECLVWSFLMGMPPAECEGMYLETEMDRETVVLHDTVENIIWELRKGW